MFSSSICSEEIDHTRDVHKINTHAHHTKSITQDVDVPIDSSSFYRDN